MFKLLIFKALYLVGDAIFGLEINLHFARHLECVELLLSRQADVSIRDKVDQE